jgi:hypothetical protein
MSPAPSHLLKVWGNYRPLCEALASTHRRAYDLVRTGMAARSATSVGAGEDGVAPENEQRREKQ